jgi:hypothetical protein
VLKHCACYFPGVAHPVSYQAAGIRGSERPRPPVPGGKGPLSPVGALRPVSLLFSSVMLEINGVDVEPHLYREVKRINGANTQILSANEAASQT